MSTARSKAHLDVLLARLEVIKFCLKSGTDTDMAKAQVDIVIRELAVLAVT